jgi:preprotein translocase subunit SecA
MTGTALADAPEIEMTYGLKVTTVPTALPVARRDYPDVAFKTRAAANLALVKEICNVGGGQPEGRPCLVGTTSVAASEQLVKALAIQGIAAELLNASPKNAPRESEIIAQAGRAGVVTVATNMAGRGTDILLGGCSKTMSRIKARSVLVENGVLSKEEVASLPPSPPESYFPCDIDDDVISALRDAALAIKKEFGINLTAITLDEILTVANDSTESDEDPEYIVKLRDATEAVKSIYAEILDEEKEIVKTRGGLYVMGTNRHESSRIDAQLRGRAGRQGDPGTSRFFLSFEDDMFVIFGGDKLNNILQTFRVSDDMPVEAPQVSDALDKVQSAVEQKYREIRTEIFRFDETLNSQRQVVYERRRKILFSTPEETVEEMKQYNKGTIESIVNAQTNDKNGAINYAKVIEKIAIFFPPVPIKESDVSGKDAGALTHFIFNSVNQVFVDKVNELELAAKAAGRPPMVLARSANYIALVTMDNAWSEHLQNMENLKESVVLRAYEGLDSVTAYRNEAFALYQGLTDTMRNNAVYSLWQSVGAAVQPVRA